MSWFTLKMRKKDKGEKFLSAYFIRPLGYILYEFSDEAKALRKYQKKR